MMYKEISSSLLPEGYALFRKEDDPSIFYRVKKATCTVGSITILKYEENQRYWLSGLYVEKEHRHRGLGRALIQIALQECAPWPARGFMHSMGRHRIGLKRLRRFYLLCEGSLDESDVVSWVTSRQPFSASNQDVPLLLS